MASTNFHKPSRTAKPARAPMRIKQLTSGRKSLMLEAGETHQLSGFTIIELLLATAIFSVVLMGALAGFLRTGNLFYKGVSLTQTQATAKQIMDGISANISNSSSVQNPNSNPSNGYTYYCIGNTRYTYNLYKRISLPEGTYTAGGNYGLLKDTLSGANSCASPSAVAFNNPVEMLGDNMRLSQLSVVRPSSTSQLYNVTVVVTYGDDASLNLADKTNPTCTGTTESQQFCAVSHLSTSVYAGISI